MKLRDILRDVPVRATQADLDSEIAAVTSDSRLVVPGALFVAIPGTQQDGAKFIGSARAKGAAAIVGETSDANVQVDNPRRALAIIAANFYGRPADKLSLVGV
ncbi:MAG TPA: Mur ligase domain-containing protein, partial [Thermoanaerobaculia bacterium]|nr:Mur ligase domain-containing protein [Thermoanaerobaculia bacterium]